MDTGITIAIVGLLGTIGGVIGTLFTTRWQLNTEREQHDEDRLIEYHKSQVERAWKECHYARQERDYWRDLALQNYEALQKTSEDLKQLNTTTGGTS